MQQLQTYLSELIKAIGTFREGNRPLFNLIAGTIALAAGICAALYVIKPGAPVIIAANLSPSDRTALALRLRHNDIDFTLGPDSIMVPSREWSRAHALLESSPGFSGGAEDFSLFDHSTMGQSDFDEQVNYQRSLQGELERTIMDIRGIDSARVMLAMGRPSPFALGPAEAERASVMLTTATGATVDAAMAAAIANLVATSVRGLDVNSITVTGNDGAILYPAQNRDGELGEAMRLRNDFEHRLETKVSALLGRIMGDGRYAVQVAVDIDASRVTSTDKLYGKGDQAIVSEEHSQSPPGSDLAGGGIPGLTSNLPSGSAKPFSDASAQPGAEDDTSSKPAPTRIETQAPPKLDEMSRKDIVNYQPSSHETNTVTAPVRIKRITVAAVLDGTYDGGHFKPLDDERLKSIKNLVVAAVGADLTRGDLVDIQSAALSQPYVPPVPNPVTQLRSLMADPLHLYGAIGAGFLLVLLMLWMIKRSISRKLANRRAAREASPKSAEKETPTKSETPAPEPSLPGEPMPAPVVDREQSDFEETKKRVNLEVERNPEAAAAILRKWLAENPIEASANGIAHSNGNGNGAHREANAA
ncbi:MAG TPA: flagellar basal-body MS-ring/collar protein FliF [Candidatus Binataceae bacterium]|nr:flagellar basal-body MS-ring/collar protein FliF [Candidatus Binataceae bacterium]